VSNIAQNIGIMRSLARAGAKRPRDKFGRGTSRVPNRIIPVIRPEDSRNGEVEMYRFIKGTSFSSSMDCGLCNAVNEEYRIIAQDEYSVALIIREPQIECHSLVLPKRHITNWSDLSREESYSLHNLVNTLTANMDKVLGCSAVAAINGMRHRTQSHIHYQVFPVYDGMRTIISRYLEIPEEMEVTRVELEKMAKKLR